MATDKLVHEYAIHFTRTFAQFIGAPAGDYEAKSITLKQAEKRADLFLIGQSGTPVVLVETQGYDDAYLYHRMVATEMLYCIQNKYVGDMDAAVIFLEESNYQAALFLDRQFVRSAALKFSPKIIVFSRLKVDELSRLGGAQLIPLFPLCDISPQEIEQQAPAWAEQIRAIPNLEWEEKKNLLVLLGGFISHRLRYLTKEAIFKMFGGFAMSDIPLFQEIEREGIQHILLKQLSARFGIVPDDVRQKIQTITQNEELERIAIELFKIQSIDELKSLVK